jgi:hypothetical protein
LIGTRFAVTVSLLLSIAAVALGVVAFMATVRDEREKPGRLVQTRVTNEYDGEPLLFPLDEFYMSPGDDGRVRALYLYPPGFFGHNRGCKIVWTAERTSPDVAEPGLFVDPCSGALFARDGSLISGEADRGLDFFGTSAGVEGLVVDSRTLFCGQLYRIPAPLDTSTPAPSPTVTLTPGLPAPFGAAPSATPPPSSTPARTRTPSITAIQDDPEKCDRVKSTSPRR